jgi:hypothetical protein
MITNLTMMMGHNTSSNHIIVNNNDDVSTPMTPVTGVVRGMRQDMPPNIA